MKGLKLSGAGYAVPGTCFRNDDFSPHLDTGDEWIRQRTGIRTRYFCRDPYGNMPGETNASLAVSAAKRALADAQAEAMDISLIVCATSTPDGAMPSVACQVQKALGVPAGVPAMDLNSACTGFEYALSAAYCILCMTRPQRYALVIGADAMSKILDFRDRSTCVLFGDGAGAAVVRTEDPEKYPCHFHLGAEGDTEALYTDEYGKLHMEGKKVFRFAVSKIQEELDFLENVHGIPASGIDHIICHQANSRILDFVKRHRHLRDGQIFMDLDRFGNTGAASVPVALADMKSQGLLREGESIFLVGFGGGLTWGSVYLKV